MAKTGKRISSKPIVLEDLLKQVREDSAGGTVVFIGTIRNRDQGKSVTALDYQVYEEMAEKRMRLIEAELLRKWPVKKVAIVHREGKLKVGEISVVVAVSAEHRAEAFEACRFAIDRIKSTLPIWKKESFGRTAKWVRGRPIAQASG